MRSHGSRRCTGRPSGTRATEPEGRDGDRARARRDARRTARLVRIFTRARWSPGRAGQAAGWDGTAMILCRRPPRKSAPPHLKWPRYVAVHITRQLHRTRPAQCTPYAIDRVPPHRQASGETNVSQAQSQPSGLGSREEDRSTEASGHSEQGEAPPPATGGFDMSRK